MAYGQHEACQCNPPSLVMACLCSLEKYLRASSGSLAISSFPSITEGLEIGSFRFYMFEYFGRVPKSGEPWYSASSPAFLRVVFEVHSRFLVGNRRCNLNCVVIHFVQSVNVETTEFSKVSGCNGGYCVLSGALSLSWLETSTSGHAGKPGPLISV